MKTTPRYLIPAVVVVVLFLQLTASSQAADTDSKEGFSSQDKPGGHWYADDIQTLTGVTHQGKHVAIITNNVLYEHVFQGDYVNATTIEGKVTRHKRSDGTITTLQQTLVFLSPTFIRVYWIALDSNSDITMGQSGITFIKWLPDVKPLGTQPPIPPPPAEPVSQPYDPMAHID